MASAHFLEFAALALALCGLVAVLAEVLIKDPGLIVRGIAGQDAPVRPVAPRSAVIAGGFDMVSANSNEKRKAA